MHAASCVEQGVDCVPGQVSSKFMCVLIVILFLLLVVEPQRSIRGTHLLSRAGVRAKFLVTVCLRTLHGTMRTPGDTSLHVRTPGAKTSSGFIEGNHISSLLRVGDRTTANVSYKYYSIASV